MERENTRRGFLFPFQRSVIQTVMIEIAKDPEILGLHSDESRIMEERSLEIKRVLLLVTVANAVQKGLDSQKDTIQLLEGALWMHKIFRKQADLNGFELQKVPNGSAEVFVENLNENPNDESFNGWAEQAKKDGLSEDYLTAFAYERPFRRVGALIVYRFFKSLEEAKNLERKLGF